MADDFQAADDLTQETFLRAVTALHRFEGGGTARAWVLAIARRTVIDSLRRTAVRPRLADTVNWETAAERAQRTDLPGFDEGVALRELVAALPRERREAFVMT